MKLSLILGVGLVVVSIIIILIWLYLGTIYVYSTEARFASPKVDLSTKIDGRIEWLGVREGDTVKVGQVIARLEGRELEQNLSKSQINYLQAEKNLKTMEKLFEQQVISARQLEIAQADYNLAYAQYKIDLTKLENRIITSPIAGTVIAKYVNQGEVIKVGMSIVTIADLQDVYVLASILEKDINRIKIGQKAFIKIDTHPGKVFVGRVEEISNVSEDLAGISSVAQKENIRPKASKFKLKIIPDRREDIFKPGMTASIKIKVK